MRLESGLRVLRDIGVARGVGVALLALLVAGCFAAKPARASAAMGAAAQAAEGSLSGCNGKGGKALYGCVADVLDRLNSDIVDNVPETRRVLRDAASGLRAATSKIQALAAISLCRSAISAALRQVKAIDGEHVRGWGGGQRRRNGGHPDR